MKEKVLHVLVCPLDWGLGHATRCIPLIRSLIDKGAVVVLAGSGMSGQLLQSEFPDLKYYAVPGMTVRYSESGLTIGAMILQFPSMMLSVLKEHKAVARIIKEEMIDVVISDNRYGVWSKETVNVFITHQLQIKTPGSKILNRVVNVINQYYIKKFEQCWIPDVEGGNNISGELSHSGDRNIPVKYIGTLSRFSNESIPGKYKRYDILVILSGPEPQRSILEKLLINKLERSDKSVLIVRGLPDNVSYEEKGNITFVNHIESQELNYHMLHTIYIICRSGYSTLMDLAAVNRSAIIIPTPGQTEQEYLGQYHHDKTHYCLQQNDLSLEKAMQEVSSLKSVYIKSDPRQSVDDLFHMVNGKTD